MLLEKQNVFRVKKEREKLKEEKEIGKYIKEEHEKSVSGKRASHNKTKYMF